MTYEDLLEGHLRFGTTPEDIVKRKKYEKILENVVIAPLWEHTIFDNLGFEVEQVSDILFNFYRDDISFSYIQMKRVGAAGLMDYILCLGVTNCKNLLFLGAVGSLDENIKIGDIVIPEYSICGDGTSRYLNKDLEDELWKKEYPTKEFTDKLIDILKEKNIRYHYVPNYSIDTVFAQFYHIDKILETGVKTIEMETANLFKCNDLLKINASALLCVSDNTVLSKSLYSGRTDEEIEYKHKIRYEVIPEVVVDLFKNMRS